MSEGTDNGGSASGATTPTSPNFDPGASEFVPNCTPAADSRTTSGQLRAAFNNTPSLSASGRKSIQPGFPLFATNTWSPSNDPPVRSAGMPPKPSWETFASNTSPLNPAHSRASPTTPGLGAQAPFGLFFNSPLLGGRAANDDTCSRISPGLNNVRYTQTQEYHDAGPQPSPKSVPHQRFVPQTEPLPQLPSFGLPDRAPTSSSGGSSGGQPMPVPGTPHSSTSFATQGFSDQSDEPMSPESGSITISDHFSKSNPEKAGTRAEVWSERHHARGLRRALKDPNAEWEEAYPGALAVLTYMNPETFQMPYGTRVINIKTEYPRNILLSLKHGKYSVMEKVAQRIMTVWEARGNSGEKVLFLFSVNGSKRFCGIAEMSGPWESKGSIPNWEHNPESNPCVGTIPVVWIFVKDVGYHQFVHIRQQNANPVGNMWNGMNFPSETGREVIEAYVKTPATSSILGHPRNYAENDGLPPASIHTRRGGFNSRSLRGGRGDYRGVSRGGHAMSQQWRQRNDTNGHGDDVESDANQTPTPATLAGQHYPVSNGGPPPTFKSSTYEQKPLSPIGPGQLLSVIVNDQGKLEVIRVDANTQEQKEGDRSDNASHLQSFRGARGGTRAALHGARSLGSLHRSSSSTSTLRAMVEPDTQRLHPASSMSTMGQSHPSPLSATWNSRDSANWRSSEVRDGGDMDSASPSGAMPSTGEETPTHRPASRSSRHAEIAASKGLQIARPSLNELKAKFHAAAAQQYSLQAQLDGPEVNAISVRVLNARIMRTIFEKRQIQAELAVMGVVPEWASPIPVRRDSLSSSESDSDSEITTEADQSDQISPVRAEDGRRLRSISKLGSPPKSNDSATFDRAPGGSDRRKRHKRNESSWDMKITKSVTDLIDSPNKKSANLVRTPLTASTFLPMDMTSPCERRALSFPTPHFSENVKSAPPNGHRSFNFPATTTQVSDQSSSTDGKDDAPAPAKVGGVRLDS